MTDMTAPRPCTLFIFCYLTCNHVIRHRACYGPGLSRPCPGCEDALLICHEFHQSCLFCETGRGNTGSNPWDPQNSHETDLLPDGSAEVDDDDLSDLFERDAVRARERFEELLLETPPIESALGDDLEALWIEMMRDQRRREDQEGVPNELRTYYLGYDDSPAVLIPLPAEEVGDEDCMVCRSAMADQTCYSLPCKHSFHQDCIRSWFKEQLERPVWTDEGRKVNCPHCRAKVNIESYPPHAEYGRWV